MASSSRNYQDVIDRMNPTGSRDRSMREVVDRLWTSFHNLGYSWVGFYLDQPDEPDDCRLLLGPCRDKPACSPIGLQGVCGQALCSMEPCIVKDVKELGENYIACNPRDRSEIVIPCLDDDGTCWGVLDVDSWEIGAFDESDERGLLTVLKAAGLTHHPS